MNTENMDRNEWIEERRKGIGGSDVGIILGFNKYKSKLQLYMEKRGEFNKEVDNEAVYFGNALEDFVAQEFSKRTGKEVIEHKYILKHPEHEFMLANLDRLVVGEKALLECKTASEYVKTDWYGEDVPASYLCQVMHYLAVTGLEKAYFAVLIGGNKFIWKEIERDEELIEMIIQAEKDFWYNNVVPGVPPEIDGSEASTSFVKELYKEDNGSEIYLGDDVDTLIQSIEVLNQDIKKLNEMKSEYENRIKLKMANAQVALTDKYKITYKSSTSVRLDTAKIKKEEKDIYEKYGKESNSRRFTYKKLEEK